MVTVASERNENYAGNNAGSSVVVSSIHEFSPATPDRHRRGGAASRTPPRNVTAPHDVSHYLSLLQLTAHDDPDDTALVSDLMQNLLMA